MKRDFEMSAQRARSGISTSGSTYLSGSYPYQQTTTSLLRTRSRPTTSRPRTVTSTVTSQKIVCAICESRGVSPTVGLAFLNLDTCEAVLSQISDSQTYVRTLHKIFVYAPQDVLFMSTAANPKSKLFSILEESLEETGSQIRLVDRSYYSENTGYEYMYQLAVAEDVEAIKASIGGNYFAVCCFAAVGGCIGLVVYCTSNIFDAGTQVYRT